MIKAGIVGGTGYTGVELLRLLSMHPQVDIHVITSRSEAGKPVADLFPNLSSHIDIAFTSPDPVALSACDIVFFATPNGTAMQTTRDLLEAGVRVIDLAADFRIKDVMEWQQWYGMEHQCPDLIDEAVYGLPEINRELIRNARLVANPGCYPTAVLLGFLPLIESGLVDSERLIADCKSGASGAGRTASLGNVICEVSENFKAYGVAGHRHLPEIRQGLQSVAGIPVGLTFVPHLTPMIRGIHATLYATQLEGDVNLQSIYEERYADEPCVEILKPGAHPETRSVRGSNMCRIAVHKPQQQDTIVVLSVIDNLVKGAAGQAVQNMNLMFGLDETLGIDAVALMP